VLLVLGEEELAVADDVELPGAAARRRRVEAACVELGGETRRPCVVAASGRAVEDFDAHASESIGFGPDSGSKMTR
jgi:hypothetical protein